MHVLLILSILTAGVCNNSCPKTYPEPPSTCTGPITIRQTSHACPAVDSRLLTQCINSCIASHCCRAGGIIAQKCVLSFHYNDSLHFVKHVPAQMASPAECFTCKYCTCCFTGRLLFLLCSVFCLQCFPPASNRLVLVASIYSHSRMHSMLLGGKSSGLKCFRSLPMPTWLFMGKFKNEV